MAPPPSDAAPNRFPACRGCPLRITGASSICYPCASAQLSVPTRACPVCSQALDGHARCRNKLCNDPSRSIDRIAAVAIKDGPIEETILRLKHGRSGWARIFGRIIAGHLDATRHADDVDLIIANPTYLGPGTTSTIAHTELVIDAAADEDVLGTWPWDTATPRALIKTGPSPRSAGGTYDAKRAAADALASRLTIPKPARTAGARIIVYDDICTTGLQLDRVARVLRHQGGAASVEGLVLARAAWQ